MFSHSVNLLPIKIVCSLVAAPVILAAPLAQAQVNARQKPAHSLLPQGRIPDTLGVNIHFTDPQNGEMKMMAEGGFRWIRMDLNWAGTEKTRGQYDFSAYDRLMKALGEQKIRPIFILDYGNPLYNPGGGSGHPDTDAAGTQPFRDAYARWAAAAVTHFKNRDIVWEIWNEPNISGFWKPQPNVVDYSNLALAACRAIRQVDAKACIVGPATSTIDLKFLESTFKAGLLKWWDAVSVHPYRQSGPETANAEYRKLRLLIEKYKPQGKTIPIISGEWGYSSGWNNYDPISQGKMLPRQWLINQLNEVPISIWYDWHDDGTDPKEPEHHFGTVANAYFENRTPVYDPKPAYLAARTLTQQLDGFEFNKRLWTGRDDEYVLLFARPSNLTAQYRTVPDQVRIAAWTIDQAAHDVVIPASSGDFIVVDHQGIKQPDVTASAGLLKMNLSDAPKYFTPLGPNNSLINAARWQRAPLEITARGAQNVRLSLSNGPPGRDAAPTISTRVLMDDSSTPLLAQLGAGKSAYFQQVPVIVSNPLSFTVLPGARDKLPIRIDNPSGEAFRGRLRVTVGGHTNASADGTIVISSSPGIVKIADFAMKNGQTEATVDVPLPTTQPNPYVKAVQSTLNFYLGAFNLKNEPIIRQRTISLRAIDDFARAGALNDYAVVPDGDAKVASTQTLSIVPAPEPILGQTSGVLKLDYKWDDGWKFVQILPPNERRSIEGRPKALQMWVYGDGSGNVANLRFTDESGQTFQPTAGQISWKGWKLVSWPLDGAGAGSWGGAKDGIIHGAIKFDTLFLLDSAGQKAGNGTIYIAAPTLLYEN